jgi:hypothetical protein
MKSTGEVTPRPRYSRDEFSRRGHELYERIRPQVEEGNGGKIVAIDIESGAYEVAAVTLSASRRLRSRHPDAQAWCVRIGYLESQEGQSVAVPRPRRPRRCPYRRS